MKTTNEFTEYNLQDELVAALTNHGFKEASEIQNLTIPPILEKKDIKVIMVRITTIFCFILL